MALHPARTSHLRKRKRPALPAKANPGAVAAVAKVRPNLPAKANVRARAAIAKPARVRRVR